MEARKFNFEDKLGLRFLKDHLYIPYQDITSFYLAA